MSTPRRTRAAGSASSTTPLSSQAHAHHHKSADELAAQEAVELLDVESFTSPRARRHAELTRKRGDSVEASAPPSLVAALFGDSEEPTVEPVPEASGEESGSGEGDGSDSEGSESDSSDSESDSDGSDSSDDESASDTDEDEFEQLLAAAKKTAEAAAKPATQPSTALGEDGDGELRFDAEERKDAPIPDLSVPALPPRALTLGRDGTARAGDAEAAASEHRGAPELDRQRYERTLSKREKAAQPKKATASELWTRIPSARDDDMPQMRRDYQALALAASLDPKRFLKGSAKSTKVPEKFAIGTMVDAPRHLQDSTVTKERKYRAGDIVNEIIGDGTVGTYAKRKFEDLQSKRMHNGRGKGWQKRAKW